MSKYTPEVVKSMCDLAEIVEARRLAGAAAINCVAHLRMEGATWSMIATALGTTTQAAWERYGLSEEQKNRQRAHGANSAIQATLEGWDLDDSMSDHESQLQRKATRQK